MPTGAASLASRSHMQRVYSTGQRYVTDSFVAGADGTTLNYTIIVPLRDEQGAMTGSVFASIYFDEIMAMLDDSLASSYVKSLVIGGKGQVMSATSGFVYDDPFLDPIRDSIAFGMTADTVQSELLALNPVSFWTVERLRCEVLHGRSHRGDRVGCCVRDEFLGSLLQGHVGYLSPGACGCCLDSHGLPYHKAQLHAADARSAHVGKVGVGTAEEAL